MLHCRLTFQTSYAQRPLITDASSANMMIRFVLRKHLGGEWPLGCIVMEKHLLDRDAPVGSIFGSRRSRRARLL
jgi:hypothetical protein